MTEGDVDAGNFFVLQDVPNDVGAGGVGADGEFADAIAVFIGAGVGGENRRAIPDCPSEDRRFGCSSTSIVRGVSLMSPYLRRDNRQRRRQRRTCRSCSTVK